MVEFTIEIPIPVVLKKGSNAIYSLNVHNRTHYRTYSTLKNKYKAIYLEELNKHDKVLIDKAKFKYELWLKNMRAIDLDNSVFVKKFLQDVMVENGWLIDDTCQHLVQNKETFGGVDKSARQTYFKVTIQGERYGNEN